ncbi:hypothetical protein TRM7557_00309 [Tritonibacter multivorans]|uniref:DUF3572 domain-containing protein n=1 Tax=Tritonibacter multivorans TaxID=928856 RepID=A0A0P1G186_9RHOB|nr:DUF3572 domain-containing protein [Tritonibacter multivorans]MDA7419347.1 DUF3572 domain-containing protein [Tritonibacter multivorans]CUH75282.1 hypothetical protein TRM7557_00309 [Tritonibacter multivorans]SFD21748.1 Protein of unknown function [Tritonibacter multivorans]
MPFSADQAEVLGIKALGWLAANEELLPVFLGASGASLSDLRDRAQDPDFLGAVLDFLLMDDAWVMGFCESETLPYERLAEARAALPGGQQMHWT